MNWTNITINGREVSVAYNENAIHVYNAFLIKDDLKIRGYRWNPQDKSWYINCPDVEAEIAVLKNNLQTPQQSSITGNIPIPVTPAVSTFNVPARTGRLKRKSSDSALATLPESCSVTDLRNRIDRLIREGIRGNVWVRGIIASEVKNYTWASYLDLKDEDENKNMFFRVEVRKNNLEKINGKLAQSGVASHLERDLPVFCNVDIHLPIRNVVDIRLNLLDILPEYTQSKIRNQREITIEKLKEEGILENQRRLVVPALISNIGLITSELGTSIKDINAGLHPYGNKYHFYFVDSRMEGANAVESVIRAISFFENECPVRLDAIVIARGGGSEQSLAVFNDLRLCRRVCESSIPIFTAIGHEKDVSAVEMCSWITPTPSTPSGIGKYLQSRYLYLQEQLTSAVTQLIHRFTTIHQAEMQRIRHFLKNIPARGTGSIKLREERFFTMARGLERSVGFTVRDHERRINTLTQRLISGFNESGLKNLNKIRSLANAMLERVKVLQIRENQRVEKTISKLDFSKRERENFSKQEEIIKKSRLLYALSLKNLGNAQKELQHKSRLIQASDPRQILKKGFTLTMDKNDRIIKSKQEFDRLKKGNAKLLFHDGSIEILKKEE